MKQRSTLSPAAVVACAGLVPLTIAAPEWGVHPDGDPLVTSEVLTASDAAARDWGPSGDVSPWASRGTLPAALLVETGSFPEGDAPSDVVFTPDGETIIVAHRESSNLILWDADTRAFVGSVAVSGLAQSVAVTPDGSKAVVACLGTNLVSIVDLGTLTETATIPIGRVPCSVSISTDGALAAVHSAFDAETAIIDIAGATLARTVTGIDTWSRLSFSLEAPAQSVQYGGPVFIDSTKLINISPGVAEVQFIDASTGAVNRVAIDASPARVGLSLDGGTAVVAHSGSTRTLTVLDTASESVTGTIATGYDLQGPIAVNADGTIAAVAVLNAVRVVDLVAGTSGFELATASSNDLISNFDGTRAVSIGFRGSVIDFASGSLLGNPNQQVSCEIGAVSPADDRAAMCSTTFGDDMVVVATDATPALEAFQLSGPLDEADRTRSIAVSADGSVAVAVSIFSDSVAVIDTATGAITARATVGQRPSRAAITPDGTTAVVANLDSTFASVIDLATGGVTNIPISRRAHDVEISPDGAYAYVAVLASGDGVWRINLDTLSVEGPKLATGNMGSVGYTNSQVSEIELSPDGSKLAVAGSFDDVVTIIDTASWSVDLNVAVGDFPTYVAFSADGTRLYCSNKNDDTVSVIAMDLAVPAAMSTVNAGDQPWQLLPDTANDRLYVTAWGDSRVNLIDLSFPVLADGVTLAGTIAGIQLDGDVLYAAEGTSQVQLGGEFGYSITQSGSLTLIDPGTMDVTGQIALDGTPSALAFDSASATAALAAPLRDGAYIIRFDGPCTAADLAEPFGVLDLGDITAFVAAFNGSLPAADLAPPAGVFDLSDITAFVTSFTAGCP